MTTNFRPYSWGPTPTERGTRFRLWAPSEDSLSLALGEDVLPMERSADGWFELDVEGRRFGENYSFVLDDGQRVPDPASRCQPDVLGPSRLVDPTSYVWKHDSWKGRAWEEAVFYELHVGTFTQEGTLRAATERLPYLADIGFTTVEILPLAQFPGKRGWGYDGVFHYAPFAGYGEPDDFKAFVDAAHGVGLMVFLDVVYNHFGPDGNFLSRYAPGFFREDNPTPWGPRIAFALEPVRRYFIENALYWMTEYHLDGLRLDAIDQIEDDSDVHILEQLSDEVHAAVPDQTIHLITENPANGTDLMAERPDGSQLYKADWNDDFHHALHSAVTGESGGYYALFATAPWENTANALAHGYLQPGKRTLRIKPPAPSALPTTSFIHFLQNHDQVGNRALGDRLHFSLKPDLHAALTELLLLSPQIPLLFQGDDHLSSRPFRFFADYDGDLRSDLWKNRETEALNFGGFPEGSGPDDIPDPSAPTTFAESKLDWGEAGTRSAIAWRTFLRKLLRTRADRIVPLLGRSLRGGQVIPAADRCIFIDWEHSSGTLKLRANLSDALRDLGQRIPNEIYPGTITDRDIALHAFSVRVFDVRNGPDERGQDTSFSGSTARHEGDLLR
jgi:malto-oligosyltrehalose trehalohydrolase